MIRGSKALTLAKSSLANLETHAALIEEELKIKDRAITIGLSEETRLRKALKVNKTMGK